MSFGMLMCETHVIIIKMHMNGEKGRGAEDDTSFFEKMAHHAYVYLSRVRHLLVD